MIGDLSQIRRRPFALTLAMGASESSAHKVTIINEDAAGNITITGSARQKLEDQALGGSDPSSGLTFAAPIESLTLRKQHQSELSRLDASWKRRMHEYEDQNKYLFLMTSKRLQDDLTKIEENYTGKNKYEPVCPGVENEVESCYRNHAKNPLRCSKQVKSFVSCVQDARFKSLMRS